MKSLFALFSGYLGTDCDTIFPVPMDNNDPEENLFDAGLGIVVGVLLLLVIALPLPDRDKPFQNCHAPNDGVTRNMRASPWMQLDQDLESG